MAVGRPLCFLALAALLFALPVQADDDDEESLSLDPQALRGLTPEMSLPPATDPLATDPLATDPLATDPLAARPARTSRSPEPPWQEEEAAAEPAVITSGTSRGQDAVDEGYRALRAGLHDDALKAYTRATRQNPALPDAHLGRGAVLEAQGRLREAALAFERALALRPGDPLPRARLVRVLGRMAPEEALERLGRLAVAWPTDPSIQAQIGLAQARAGNFLAALGALEQANTLAPRDLGVALNLAVAADRAGERERAVAAYRRALGLLRAQGNPTGLDLSAVARRLHWLETGPAPTPLPLVPASPTPPPPSSPASPS